MLCVALDCTTYSLPYNIFHFYGSYNSIDHFPEAVHALWLIKILAGCNYQDRCITTAHNIPAIEWRSRKTVKG